MVQERVILLSLTSCGSVIIFSEHCLEWEFPPQTWGFGESIWRPLVAFWVSRKNGRLVAGSWSSSVPLCSFSLRRRSVPCAQSHEWSSSPRGIKQPSCQCLGLGRFRDRNEPAYEVEKEQGIEVQLPSVFPTNNLIIGDWPISVKWIQSRGEYKSKIRATAAFVPGNSECVINTRVCGDWSAD